MARITFIHIRRRADGFVVQFRWCCPDCQGLSPGASRTPWSSAGMRPLMPERHHLDAAGGSIRQSQGISARRPRRRQARTVSPPFLGSKIATRHAARFRVRRGDLVIDLGCGSGHALWNRWCRDDRRHQPFSPSTPADVPLLADLQRLRSTARRSPAWSLDVLEHLSPGAALLRESVLTRWMLFVYARAKAPVAAACGKVNRLARGLGDRF